MFCCSIIFAQAPRLTATVKSNKIFQNSVFDITFKLHNAQGSSFREPNFTPFKATGPPSTNSAMSIINGAMAKEMSYTYRLLASDVGEFTIKPATIIVNGQTITSNELTIEVLESTVSEDAELDMFVDIEVSDDEVYVGQQMFVDYVIYTTRDVRSFDIIDESSYDGFFVTETRYRESTQKEIRDGKEYFTKTMVRRILYPQQTGRFSIDPTSIQLGVIDGNSQRRGIFLQANLKPVVVKTNSVEIIVKNLPKSSNPAFANAVGNYSIKSNLDKQKVTTDDAITIQIEVTGTGDPKLITPPSFINPDLFDVYDPTTLVERSTENKQSHVKVFEYIAVPKKPGNYIITPEFEYFDVDSSRYISLRSTPRQISVSQGEGNKDAILLQKEEIVMLNPIKTSTSFSKGSGSFHGSLPYWLLLGMGLVSMFVTGGIQHHRKKSGAFDPVLIRKEKAQRVAMEKLNVADSYKKDGKGAEFYEEIIRAMKEYLADKFSIPATYLKKTSIEQSLKEKTVDPETISELVSLFNTCELNLYAGGKASSMQESFENAKYIITQLEQ